MPRHRLSYTRHVTFPWDSAASSLEPPRDGSQGRRGERGASASSAETDARESAERRLEAAQSEQDGSRECYERAVGSASEWDARAQMCAASERVAARRAWLHWLEDAGYRGLNAGPFSLREEGSAREVWLDGAR